MVRGCTEAGDFWKLPACLLAGGLFALGGAGCGGSDSGAALAGSSDGCRRTSNLTPGAWVEQTLTVDGVARVYVVRLPDGYNGSRPYPVVYQFHGCSNSLEADNPPLENEAGADAILVRARAVDICWVLGGDSPDVAFFDALVTAIEGSLCADQARRFVSGYSRGAYLSHTLACVRADRIRAIATIAGGSAGSGCGGPVAALLVHDRDDVAVNISESEAARDQLAERNHCAVDQARQSVPPAPCEAYVGCGAGHPVVWCETSGHGHDRQDAFVVPAFWDFFTQF